MNKVLEGKILQIIGSVVDVSFDDRLPAQNELLICDGSGRNVRMEVKMHRSKGVVRCIALDSTDGLERGHVVRTTGAPLSVHVGTNTLGRVMNALG